jgi:DNA-binding transcriptional ArsR family regulator
MVNKNVCIRKNADHLQIERCKELLKKLNEPINTISSGLELAVNGVRFRILILLKEEGKLCVCDLSDILGMTIPAVSQHLTKLKERGLLESQKDAQMIYYSLKNEYKPLLYPLFDSLYDEQTLAQI